MSNSDYLWSIIDPRLALVRSSSKLPAILQIIEDYCFYAFKVRLCLHYLNGKKDVGDFSDVIRSILSLKWKKTHKNAVIITKINTQQAKIFYNNIINNYPFAIYHIYCHTHAEGEAFSFILSSFSSTCRKFQVHFHFGRYTYVACILLRKTF